MNPQNPEFLSKSTFRSYRLRNRSEVNTSQPPRRTDVFKLETHIRASSGFPSMKYSIKRELATPSTGRPLRRTLNQKPSRGENSRVQTPRPPSKQNNLNRTTRRGRTPLDESMEFANFTAGMKFSPRAFTAVGDAIKRVRR